MSALLVIDLLSADGFELQAYKPGQSVRTHATITLDGVLADPTSPAVVVTLPGGVVLSPAPTPVKDSTGKWHVDYVPPVGTKPGLGVERWTSTGGSPSQCAVAEKRFQVSALASPSE